MNFLNLNIEYYFFIVTKIALCLLVVHGSWNECPKVNTECFG